MNCRHHPEGQQGLQRMLHQVSSYNFITVYMYVCVCVCVCFCLNFWVVVTDNDDYDGEV